MNTVNYRTLWSYPLVFRAVRRVDHEFGYLYQQGSYIPLKRNLAWYSFLFPWLKMGQSEYKSYFDFRKTFCAYQFEKVDELSHFFAMFVEDSCDDMLDYSEPTWDELLVEKDNKISFAQKEVVEQLEKLFTK